MVNVLPRNPLASLNTSAANDRLKNSFNAWYWGSIAVAALLHFLVFTLVPQMTVAALTAATPPGDVIIPDRVELPPPPEEIRKPAIPVVATDLKISHDIPFFEQLWDQPPLEVEPPAPTGNIGADNPPWTPYEVSPEMRNVEEFRRALLQNYPAALRNAGIGGTVLLWVHIDGSGTVTETRVEASSGYPELDQAARSSVEVARFSPALNRDQRVPVWVQIPVTFQVND